MANRKHTKENIEDDKPIAQLGGAERGKAKLEILKRREQAGVVTSEPPGEVW